MSRHSQTASSDLRRREPIFQIPFVIVALVALFALIQAAQIVLSDTQTILLLRDLAFVPASWTAAIDPAGAREAIAAQSVSSQPSAVFFAQGGLRFWTPLTYAFLHGGWTHLGANAVWLIAFGAPVARRLGSFRFVALFCVASIGGALAHWATHIFDYEPVVGASAGISGIMAAAVRFVFQPGGPVGRPLEPGQAPAPALSVGACFLEPRSLTFIIMWFLVNFLIGLAAEPLGISTSPVAWQAHIGGFFVGLVLFSLFDRPPPPTATNADDLLDPEDFA